MDNHEEQRKRENENHILPHLHPNKEGMSAKFSCWFLAPTNA